MFNMFESFLKNRDPEIPRADYRFDEENVDVQQLPVTFGDITNLSQFFDAFINEVRYVLIDENLDPLIIPEGLHKEINGLVFTGTIDIQRISVHNLSHICRQSAFKADYVDRVMTITIPISFIDVKLFADFKLTAGSVLIAEGRIMGRVGDLTMFITFALNFVRKQLLFIDFGVPKSDDISITFKGDGLSKYLLNTLTPIVIALFKNLIIGVIVDQVNTLIKEQFKLVNKVIKDVRHEFGRQPIAATPSQSASEDSAFD